MDQENIKAMLAHKYNEDKADYPAFIQPKLDGVRCLFTAKGAFSRATFTYFQRTQAGSYRHPHYKCIRNYE